MFSFEALQSFLSPPTTGHFCQKLLLVSVELVLLAVLFWTVIKILRLRSARLCALLWLLLMVKAVLGPMFEGPLRLVSIPSPPSVTTTSVDPAAITTPLALENPVFVPETKSTGIPVESGLPPIKVEPYENRAYQAPVETVNPRVSASVNDMVEEDAALLSETPAVIASSLASFKRWTGNLSAADWAAGVWLVGFALMAVVTFRDLLRIRRWRREAAEAPEDILDLLDAEAKRLGLSRRPELRVSDRIDSPVLIGLFRPMILMPHWLTDASHRERLRWILSHELMHGKMKDSMGLAVRRLAQTLMWFHPAVWWAGRRWEEAMELACDRALVQSDGQAQDYAGHLYGLLENLVERRKHSPAGMVLSATRTQVGQRIAALLAQPLRMPAHLGKVSTVGLIAVAALCLSCGIGIGSLRDVDSNKEEVLAFDDFDGSLSLDWSVENADPTHFSLTKKPGALTITTQQGSFHTTYTNYKNLFLIDCPSSPSGDFQVTACISGFKPDKLFQQAGLVIGSDVDHYLKWIYQFSRLQETFVYKAESNGMLTSGHKFTGKVVSESFWLRITKRGNLYRFFVSFDGESFEPYVPEHDDYGSPILNGALQWGDGRISKVGFYAQNGTTSQVAEIDASFESFEVRTLPAKPGSDATQTSEAATASTVLADAAKDRTSLSFNADDVPGTLFFHGRYQHRSRGSEYGVLADLWLKETRDGGITAVSHLPFMGSTTIASGDKENRLTRYGSGREASGERPGYRMDLKLLDGKVLLTRRGVREDTDDKELRVPAGAMYDPNSRPDPYCAANILLRGIDLREGRPKDLRVYDWDITGEAFADYTIRFEHIGKEEVEVPAGTFEANHIVLTQLTSANTWFKKRANHVTDFWVLDNGAIVRVFRHREPYEILLAEWDSPKELPGLKKRGSGGEEADSSSDARPPGSRALWFDGAGDYVHVPHDAAFDLGTACTLEAWVCIQPGGTYNPRFISKGWDVRQGYEFGTWGTSERRSAYFGAAGIGFLRSNRMLSAGRWHHVAVACGDGKARMYLDGQQVAYAAQTRPLPFDTTPLAIGRNSSNATDNLLGAIDEVRIWNVARSVEEIREAKDKKLSGKEEGLVAYWDFEEGEDQVANDKTGNGHHGRLGSSTGEDEDDPKWMTPDEAVSATGGGTSEAAKTPAASSERTVNYLGQSNFPQIMNLDPKHGTSNVDPARKHITVTFDRPMRGGYSWIDKGERPPLVKIEWINDRQCRAWIKLEPGRAYGTWLNFGSNTSKFRSAQGVSSDRFYWLFQTLTDEGNSESAEKTPVSVAATKGKVLAFDDFDGVLGLDWEILNENATHHSLKKRPGALTVTTQEGSFAWEERDYKNVFLTECLASSSQVLQVTTCITGFKPDEPYQQTGLLFWNDEDNYLKWATQANRKAEFRVVYLAETQANRVSHRGFSVLEKREEIWLRAIKRGNRYEFFTSFDGKTFTPFLSEPDPHGTSMVDGQLSWGDGSVKKVGIYAQNGTQSKASEIDASIEFFEARILPR